MKRLLVILTLMLMSSTVFAFDHRHADWDALLKQQVVLITNGNASQVDYAGFQPNRAALKQYLDALSAVSEADYRRWSQPQQLAFLINAYNAFIPLIDSFYHLRAVRIKSKLVREAI